MSRIRGPYVRFCERDEAVTPHPTRCDCSLLAMHLSEFATASVSSPGLEDYLGLPDAMIADAEQGIGLLVDGLDYLNINQRGYMVVTFTQDEALANWYFVDTVKSREYTVDNSRSAARKTLPGAGNRTVDPV